jgi:SAM-dependent methyltransferase
MTENAFDQSSWERRWSQVMRDSPEKLANRPPNSYLLTEVADLQPGTALDAGCGHGAEAIWLASAGWRVTAVDFSATALDFGRSWADSSGPDVASRIEWVEADLGSWSPTAGRFDLVSCLYVHVAGSVPEMVRRLGSGVAAGGTLLLAGHRPVDPATGGPSAAAGQVQVSVENALEALDSDDWDVVVAEERPRTVGPSGVDALVRAVRRGHAPPPE